jgi:hypothetical protein
MVALRVAEPVPLAPVRATVTLLSTPVVALNLAKPSVDDRVLAAPVKTPVLDELAGCGEGPTAALPDRFRAWKLVIVKP